MRHGFGGHPFGASDYLQRERPYQPRRRIRGPGGQEQVTMSVGRRRWAIAEAYFPLASTTIALADD